jgi:hypothetical protein
MKRYSHPLADFVAAAVTCMMLLAGLPHADGATFIINNIDGPGEGFNDPTPASPVGGNPGTTLGQQRLNAFQRAAEIWGGAIESNVPISIEAAFDPLSCNASSAILGSAGAIQVIRDFPNAPQSDTWYHTALANALAGTDLIPDTDDISATFNSSIDNNDNCLSGIDWYLGFDDNPGGGISLLVVLLHEFAHGLGFSGFVNLSNGGFLLNRADVFSVLTFDNSHGLHWHEMSRGQRRNSARNTGNVVWDGLQVRTGANAILVNGQDGAGNVRLYAPNPVQSGSSIYHYDTVASPNLLMEPFINNDLDDRLDLTDDLMVDIGWVLLDSDGDGVPDVADNCKLAANGPNDTAAAGPSQNDTDGDGYGNMCDPDFNDNGIVDPTDFSLLKSRFGQTGFPDQDLNGNGIVDPTDFSILKGMFGLPPGPSGLAP